MTELDKKWISEASPLGPPADPGNNTPISGKALEDLEQRIRNEIADPAALPSSVARRSELQPANSFVLFGDSITALCADTGTTVDWFRWAQRIAGYPATVLSNASEGGDTTTQMLARINEDVIAEEPAWCVVLGGANDLAASETTAAEVIANLESIYNKLRKAGIRVIAGTIIPSSNIESATKLGRLETVNTWIKNYALTDPNVVVVDWYPALVDTETGGPVEAYFTEEEGSFVHPNHRGCMRMGRMLAPVLAEHLRPADRLNSSPVSNANGNLLSNGLMAGSTNGLATDWLESESGGTDLDFAKVASGDLIAGEWQEVTYKAGEPAVVYAQNKNAGSDWEAGEEVYGSVEIETDLPWGDLIELQLAVQTFPANERIAEDPIIGSEEPLLPAEDLVRRMVLRTNGATIPEGAERVQFMLRIKAGSEGTIRFRRAEIRKVES